MSSLWNYCKYKQVAVNVLQSCVWQRKDCFRCEETPCLSDSATVGPEPTDGHMNLAIVKAIMEAFDEGPRRAHPAVF